MIQNDYTTLVSCRLDNNIVKKLDDYVLSHRYYKRSSLINRILNQTIGHMSSGEFYNLIKY